MPSRPALRAPIRRGARRATSLAAASPRRPGSDGVSPGAQLGQVEVRLLGCLRSSSSISSSWPKTPARAARSKAACDAIADRDGSASGPRAAPKASPWVDRLQRLVIGHDDLGIHRGPDRPSVAPVDSVGAAWSIRFLIVGMTCQPGCHEGAQGHDRLSAGSNVVGGATNQDRAQALALVTRLDLGVDEVITTASEVINGEAGDPPVQLEDI